LIQRTASTSLIMGNCNWLTYCYPRINLGFWVGISILYMLLIQYLQFVDSPMEIF